MRWVGLACLVVAVGFGIKAVGAGLGPNHGHGEIVGQLRVWGQQDQVWHGEMIVDAGAMKRRFGSWTKRFPFTVTDPDVAEQVTRAAQAAGTIEVEYRQWLVKPLGHNGDCTVTAARPVQ